MSTPLSDSPVQIIGPDPEPGHATGGVAALWRHRHLLWDFVVRDLKHRYLGSSIGFFWTVVTPFLELVTYTFVFHILIQINFNEGDGWADYALYLFCGMITWLALSDGFSRCTSVMVDHSHLIKKVNFPTIVLPGHIVVSAVLNQFIRLGVLAVAMVFLNRGLSWHFLLVPFVVFIQAVFIIGGGLLLATANVYFRDTIHWVNAVLLLWMFVTPIFYPTSILEENYNLLLQLNPLAHLVGIFHELVLNQRLPHIHSVLVAVVMAFLSLLVGYSVFHHHRHKFADLI